MENHVMSAKHLQCGNFTQQLNLCRLKLSGLGCVRCIGKQNSLKFI